MDPERGERRREQQDVERTRRLEPARGNLEAADHAIGEPFREQVQRRARLFVAGPEQRGRNEEREHDQHASALGAVETGEREQVAEIRHGHGEDRDGGPACDVRRVERDDAGCNQRRDDSDGAQHGQDSAPLPLVGCEQGWVRRTCALASVTQVMARKLELREAQGHRDGGACKSRAPTVLLRKPGRRQ